MNDDVSILEQARPTVAVVLGSGLGSVAEALGVEAVVPYHAVPGLPLSRVPGHAGRFVLVRVEDQPVVIAQGRSHLYEGLSAAEVAAGIRFLAGIGVRRVLLTNAAGSINEAWAPGELMLLTDHINLQGTSPLLGGPHFHDMTTVYDPAWRQRFMLAAAESGVTLRQGVYAAVLGPQYETPAEIRMLRTLGADAVGMSTVPEAIQARALDLHVAGISILTNWAAGVRPGTLHHEEVVTVGRQAADSLTQLLTKALVV